MPRTNLNCIRRLTWIGALVVGLLVSNMIAAAMPIPGRPPTSSFPFADTTELAQPADAAIAVPPEELQSLADWYIVLLRADAPDPGLVASNVGAGRGLILSHVYRSALRGFAVKIPPAAVKYVQRSRYVEAVIPDVAFTLADQSMPVGVSRIEAAPSYKNAVAKIDGNDERVDIDVAVVDTGIDNGHPGLNYVGGFDCTGLGHPGNDANGHGTGVAGIIGAKDNNGGVVGVAPGARLWSVKVLDAQGFIRGSSLLCGIDYVTSNASLMEVANISISGYQTAADDGSCGSIRDYPSLPYHRAICNSVAAGVTWVAAAGNDCQNAADFIPAAYDEVITVSAMVDTDGRPGGLGPSGLTLNCVGDPAWYADDSFARSNFGSDIDLAAPGLEVLSTKRGGGTGMFSGTSFAAPHVTGAAALYLASHHGAMPAQVRAALVAARETVVLLGDPDGIPEGVVNVNDRGAGYIDPTAPTGPVLAVAESEPDEHAVGTTLYYNPASGNSGVYTVTATTADLETGIARVEFPKVLGDGPATDTTAPFQATYGWTASDGATVTKAVVAVNGVEMTSTASFTVTPDSQNPAVDSAGNDGFVITASASDAASGVASVEARQCLGWTCSWADASTIGTDASAPYTFTWPERPAQSYSVLLRATDNVGRESQVLRVRFDGGWSVAGMTTIQGGLESALMETGIAPERDARRSARRAEARSEPATPAADLSNEVGHGGRSKGGAEDQSLVGGRTCRESDRNGRRNSASHRNKGCDGRGRDHKRHGTRS